MTTKIIVPAPFLSSLFSRKPLTAGSKALAQDSKKQLSIAQSTVETGHRVETQALRIA